MKLAEIPGGFALYKEKTAVGRCEVTATAQGAALTLLTIVPEWRRKGYGSYLLKEVLRSFGGYDREAATVFTAPLPENAAELAFWGKFGFAAEGGQLVRRRTPDLTAVKFVQDFLAARLVHPQLCVDATCGNGGDTAFLCGLTAPAGRVLAFDIQQAALDATRKLLERQDGVAPVSLFLDSHANMGDYARPGTVSCIVFNLGYLPSGDHSIATHKESTIAALEQGLELLKTGGCISLCIYSGGDSGFEERDGVLEYLKGLDSRRFLVVLSCYYNRPNHPPIPVVIYKL